MTNYVVVDSVTHRRTRVNTAPSARLGDDVGVVGVVPAEFASLIAAYPIFLRKNSRTGRFEPCALLGVSATENLFLAADRWDAPYVPLQRQSQPFQILAGPAEEPGGAPRVLLTLDMDSPRVQADEGEILFLEDGSSSRYLERVASMLRALLEGSGQAHAFGARLDELDLIEPVRLEAALIDGTQANLEGLYSVKPDALRGLSGAALESLQAAGFLEFAYLQLASLVHVQGLIARKNRRLNAGEP
jgi:hypothetical protein